MEWGHYEVDVGGDLDVEQCSCKLLFAHSLTLDLASLKLYERCLLGGWHKNEP